MGRYNLSAQRVYGQATQLLKHNRLSQPPPWYNTVGAIPPSEKLVRPPMQRHGGRRARRSRMFIPAKLEYQEDELRYEYFNDHPWDLARPRVILEGDGRDGEKWDWGVALDVSLNRPRVSSAAEATEERRIYEQRQILKWERMRTQHADRPVNGEAVVQRQHWLIQNANLSTQEAYDHARKELYRVRHQLEIETRVAREEAMATGAFFGLGPNEVGMKLEDEQFEGWKEWAQAETQRVNQIKQAAYAGGGAGEMEEELDGPSQAEIDVVEETIPASRQGQEAKGGAFIHP